MARTNTNLLNSLMWNLREMTNLIKLIRTTVGDVKCKSWRHPLMSCGELDVLQLLEDNKNCDRYTYLLELTFDRHIYILNLFIKYLESCETLANFKPGKNIERPQNLSIASILYMIWDRIQYHFVTRTETSESPFNDGLTISSFTQSDITLISSCTTCQLAQDLVTQIVLKMENYFEGYSSSSAVLTERKLIKEKLIGSSNWSAMITWVNAVLKDVSFIQEEAQKIKTENMSLKNRIDSGEANLLSKMKKQDDEARTLQRLCREYEEKKKGLELELKALQQERQRQNQEFSDLQNKYAELNRNLMDLDLKKKSLEEKLIEKERIDLDKTAELKAILNSELKLRKSAQAEIENLKNSLANMKDKMEEENYKCIGLESKANEAEVKIRELNEENNKLYKYIDGKQKEIDNYKNKLLEAFPDISNDDIHGYKATGNPLIDMKCQIEANNLRISQLTADNETLMQTISRIEAIKK